MSACPVRNLVFTIEASRSAARAGLYRPIARAGPERADRSAQCARVWLVADLAGDKADNFVDVVIKLVCDSSINGSTPLPGFGCESNAAIRCAEAR